MPFCFTLSISTPSPSSVFTLQISHFDFSLALALPTSFGKYSEKTRNFHNPISLYYYSPQQQSISSAPNSKCPSCSGINGIVASVRMPVARTDASSLNKRNLEIEINAPVTKGRMKMERPTRTAFTRDLVPLAPQPKIGSSNEPQCMF